MTEKIGKIAVHSQFYSTLSPFRGTRSAKKYAKHGVGGWTRNESDTRAAEMVLKLGCKIKHKI